MRSTTSSSQKASFFSFNNISAMKRAIYFYGPQTVDDLVENVREALQRDVSHSEVRDVYVLPALNKQSYFLRLPGGRWDIDWELAGENRFALKVLEQAGTPLSLKEIRKRVGALLSKDSTEVRIGLENDPNFVGIGDQHFALSRWHMLNDNAYELLSRHRDRYLSKNQIMNALKTETLLLNETIMFWPEIDSRFVSRRPDGSWGLREWVERTTKDRRCGAPEREAPSLTVAPTELQVARIAHLSDALRAFVGSQSSPVRSRQIAEKVLGVLPSSPDYLGYAAAVRKHLSERNSEYLEVGTDLWRTWSQLPRELAQQVEGVSVPRVVARIQTNESSEPPPLEETPEKPISSVRGIDSVLESWKVTLTYVNRRDGTLTVPRNKRGLFPAGPSNIIEVELLIPMARTKHQPVWYNAQSQTLCGLTVVFDELSLIPGSVFQLTRARHRLDQFMLTYSGEIDTIVAQEQGRLAQPEMLKRVALSVGKPFWQILIEAMEAEPDGIEFKALFFRVSEVRPVAISTLRNLLSRLPCFRQTDGRSGVWHFDAGRREATLRMLRKTVRRTLTPAIRTTEESQLRLQLPEPIVNMTNESDLSRKTTSLRGAASETGDSVLQRTATLLAEGFDSDKGLIRAYLSRFHGIDIDERFLHDSVPPPESIRRARQSIGSGAGPSGGPLESDSVIGRVRTLLGELPTGGCDKQLIRAYYMRFHTIDIPEAFLQSGVPSLETIRRSRQLLTSKDSDAPIEPDTPIAEETTVVFVPNVEPMGETGTIDSLPVTPHTPRSQMGTDVPLGLLRRRRRQRRTLLSELVQWIRSILGRHTA